MFVVAGEVSLPSKTSETLVYLAELPTIRWVTKQEDGVEGCNWKDPAR